MSFDFSTSPQRVAAMKAEPAGNLRGRALEQLVSEMFSALPGVTVADRNVLGGAGEAELDILFANEQREDGLPAFGRDVLVECKSSDDALGSSGVNHFVTQAERRRLPWSIIVSLAGLTGDTEDLRSAHHEISRNAEKGTRVLLFVENELAGLRSAEHLAAVTERKRRQLVGKLRAVTLSDEEIKELDPNKSSVTFTRGLAGIEHALRVAQEQALTLIFDAAVDLPPAEDDEERLARAAASVASLDAQLTDHAENPDDDPLWRRVHDEVVMVGAAFATLLEHDIGTAEGRRIAGFEVRTSAPQRLDAFVGGDLWTMLAQYRLKQVRDFTGVQRRRGALAMLGMCVEQIIGIDDIDPRDVFDDYYEEVP